MMTTLYMVLAILVAAGCTIGVRILPFLIFSKRKELPKIIVSLEHTLPQAVMMALLFYCIRNVNFQHLHNWTGTIIAVTVTACLHLWRRNVLLSIITGTVTYMVLLQLGLS
ncbi:MAG: AzlD domain-containing protein [Sphaerochaetaceae bacterium]|nr:AzlD domain-containing protein [Sphaerochaetaceae bacterium]NLO60598.1 branched-chain amino acid transporter AzlD [Spirochaetales bacterium]MDD2405537.1 AzlD domain-containing protein [Sphaerochaetaceae bacterium]MDD3670401.1 AzlD domain-containing protein [Sphaerochaetaceae bacterium]MDD4762710.1 AzlD domain-containing protein [Sphaerochaetaceae bacterium]